MDPYKYAPEREEGAEAEAPPTERNDQSKMEEASGAAAFRYLLGKEHIKDS